MMIYLYFYIIKVINYYFFVFGLGILTILRFMAYYDGASL